MAGDEKALPSTLDVTVSVLYVATSDAHSHCENRAFSVVCVFVSVWVLGQQRLAAALLILGLVWLGSCAKGEGMVLQACPVLGHGREIEFVPSLPCVSIHETHIGKSSF